MSFSKNQFSLEVAPNFVGVGQTTMSSVEIAELCAKRHFHVMRDIKTMLTTLKLDVTRFGGTYLDDMNRENPCFHLPRDLTMTLITGYNIPLRKRVIDRLDELERWAKSPSAVLNDPETLRKLLLKYAEKVLALEARIDELVPAKAALDRIARADGSLCITDAAKALQMRPKDLSAWLRQHRWIYKRAGTAYELGYQCKLERLLEHKVVTVYRADGSKRISQQVRVTAKGLTRLAMLVKPHLSQV